VSFYTAAQREMQERIGVRALAHKVESMIVSNEVDESSEAFIASRDFFFLASVDASGMPTVSYKGGDVGLVHVAGPTTLLFPNYDGNAMFLSMGNVVDTASIGMLFIDMEKPNRVRVQARATVSADDPELGRWPGADLVVRAEVTKVFKNCGRYIHKHVRIGQSPYVPDADGKVAHPSWKRIDALQPVMPQVARERTALAGGTITPEEYDAKVADGTS